MSGKSWGRENKKHSMTRTVGKKVTEFGRTSDTLAGELIGPIRGGEQYPSTSLSG